MTNPYAPPPADGARAEPPRQDEDRRDDTRGEPPAAPEVTAPSGGTAPSAERPPPAAPGPAPGQDLPAERYGRGAARPTPQRPPEDPAAYAALRSRLGLFVLLLAASLVVLMLPLPFQAASVVFSVWAVVVGIRAVVGAWRAGIRRAAVPLAAGLVGVALWSTLSMGVQLALWPVLVERQDCLRSALTTSAREACEERYQQQVQERLSRLQQQAPAGS
ncbi:MAG: hypothetical protein H5T83_05685 [Actinotalea sp.]|nr:hypothetical protein [Actinotalea sp.]